MGGSASALEGGDLEGPGGTWRDLEGPGGTWRDLEGPGGGGDLKGPGGIWRDLEGSFQSRTNKTCSERDDCELAMECRRCCVAMETWQEQCRGSSPDERRNIYTKPRLNQRKHPPGTAQTAGAAWKERKFSC